MGAVYRVVSVLLAGKDQRRSFRRRSFALEFHAANESQLNSLPSPGKSWKSHVYISKCWGTTKYNYLIFYREPGDTRPQYYGTLHLLADLIARL